MRPAMAAQRLLCVAVLISLSVLNTASPFHGTPPKFDGQRGSGDGQGKGPTFQGESKMNRGDFAPHNGRGGEPAAGAGRKILQAGEPSARRYATMVSVERMLYLFGGQETHTQAYDPSTSTYGGLMNDVWSLDTTQSGDMSTWVWEEKIPSQPAYAYPHHDTRWWHGEPPKVRYMHAAVALKTRVESQIGAELGRRQEDSMLVFGGMDDEFRPMNDLWHISTHTWRWIRLDRGGQVPEKRSGHSMVAVGTKVYLFGGSDRVNLNDVYELETDVKTPVWVKTETQGVKPYPRRFHGMTVVNNTKIWLFGGLATIEGQRDPIGLNDLWFLDLSSRYPTWVEVRPSVDRFRNGGENTFFVGRSGAVFQAVGRSLWIFGGKTHRNNTRRDDIWGLDTTTDSPTWYVFEPQASANNVLTQRNGAAYAKVYGHIYWWGGTSYGDGQARNIQQLGRFQAACPRGRVGSQALKNVTHHDLGCRTCWGGKDAKNVTGYGGAHTPDEGATHCDICPAGKFATGSESEGASVCRDCVPGTWSKAQMNQCFRCKPGSYSSWGATTCSICPPGSYSGERFGYCKLCTPGKYQQYPNRSSCLDCPDGGLWPYGDGRYEMVAPVEGATECVRSSTLLYKSDGKRPLEPPLHHPQVVENAANMGVYDDINVKWPWTGANITSAKVFTPEQLKNPQSDFSGNTRTAGTGHYVGEFGEIPNNNDNHFIKDAPWTQREGGQVGGL